LRDNQSFGQKIAAREYYNCIGLIFLSAAAHNLSGYCAHLKNRDNVIQFPLEFT